MTRIIKCSARFLHRHIPAKERRFTGAKCSQHGRRDARHVRIIHDRDEDLHLRADGQADACARDLHALSCEIHNVAHFRGRESLLAINEPGGKRIVDDWLPNLAGDSGECRDRIWKWRGRSKYRWILRIRISLQHGRPGSRCRCSDVGEADATDEHVIRRNARGGAKSPLPSKCHVLVSVGASSENKRILSAESYDRRRRSVTGHADPAHKNPIFIKRNATR